MTAKYLNPYTDFSFKKLFGEEESKDLLMDFLNQLLPSHHQVATLQFKFLQMPLFNKQEYELETHFDKWVYFLKNLESFDHIPQILKEPVFEKGFEIAELAHLKLSQLKPTKKVY